MSVFEVLVEQEVAEELGVAVVMLTREDSRGLPAKGSCSRTNSSTTRSKVTVNVRLKRHDPA